MPGASVGEGLRQRRLGHGALRRRHQRGLAVGHVGGELVVEHVRADRELVAAGGDRVRGERVAQRAARRARGQVEGALAGLGHERGDVDEADDGIVAPRRPR